MAGFIQLPRDKGLGELLGTGLGQGLQTGIMKHLEQLQNQQQRQRVAGGLGQIPGVSAQQAQGLANLPESTLNTVLKELGKEKTRGQEQQFLSSLGLSPALAGKSPQVQGAFIKDYLRKQEGKEAETLLEGIRGDKSPQESRSAESIKNIGQPSSPLEIQPISPKATAPGALALKEIIPLQKALESESYTPSQKTKIRNEIERIEDRFEKKQEKVDATTKPFYENIKSLGESARESNERLDKMLELIKGGKLPATLPAAFIDFINDKIGIDFSAALGSDAEAFNKLKTDFLRDAKSLFGTRVTDNEIRLFLKRIPSLSQTQQGKLKIINTLKHFYDAAQIKNDVMNEIIEENGGYRPSNLQDLVDKRAKPLLKKEATLFKSGVFKPEVQEALPSSEQLEKEYRFRKGPVGQVFNLLGQFGQSIGL